MPMPKSIIELKGIFAIADAAFCRSRKSCGAANEGPRESEVVAQISEG
jgi:hypothetical protein